MMLPAPWVPEVAWRDGAVLTAAQLTYRDERERKARWLHLTSLGLARAGIVAMDWDQDALASGLAKLCRLHACLDDGLVVNAGQSAAASFGSVDLVQAEGYVDVGLQLRGWAISDAPEAIEGGGHIDTRVPVLSLVPSHCDALPLARLLCGEQGWCHDPTFMPPLVCLSAAPDVMALAKRCSKLLDKRTCTQSLGYLLRAQCEQRPCTPDAANTLVQAAAMALRVNPVAGGLVEALAQVCQAASRSTAPMAAFSCSGERWQTAALSSAPGQVTLRCEGILPPRHAVKLAPANAMASLISAGADGIPLRAQAEGLEVDTAHPLWAQAKAFGSVALFVPLHGHQAFTLEWSDVG